MDDLRAAAIEIRVLGRGDEGILTNVAAALFDNPIDANLTAEFIADPRHHEGSC